MWKSESMQPAQVLRYTGGSPSSALTFQQVTVRISWPRVSSNPGSFRPQYKYLVPPVDHYNFFFGHTHTSIFSKMLIISVGRYIKAKRSLYILDAVVARRPPGAASPHHFYFNSEKVGYSVLLGCSWFFASGKIRPSNVRNSRLSEPRPL